MAIKQFAEKITKESVIESPKDEILKGVIIEIERGELKDFLNPEVHSKFDNLNQDTLKINYEVKFKESNIKGNDKMSYYEKPQENSKLGKFLTKYDVLEVGKEIKVVYDGKGFGKIKVD